MPLTTIYAGGTRVIGGSTAIQQTLHPQVMNFLNRLVVAGYSPSINEIDAINNLILSMVANEIYDKCQAIYPVIGSSTSTVGFDLKNAFNMTFTGTWTVASTGMKTNGSTANRANSNYNPRTNGSQNNQHLAIYVRQSQATPSVVMGCWDGTLFTQINASTTTAGLGNININNVDANRCPSTGITDSKGFHIGSRIASNDQRLFINGIQNGATQTGASQTPPNLNIWYAVRNDSNSPALGSPQEIAFSSIGTGLTSQEAKRYYILVQAFQSKLGRQV
jgi:hypothetical protein